MKKYILIIGLIFLSFSLSINGQITIDGAFADWVAVPVLGNDATGDGSNGWDFDNIYVTDDAINVYVRVEMASTGEGTESLILFISVDPQNEPTTLTGFSNGWWNNGYDFMVQYYAPNWTLFRYNGDGSTWVWDDMGQNGVHVWNADDSYDDIEISLKKSVLDNPNIGSYSTPTQIAVYTIVNGYGEVAGRDGSHGGYLYTLASPLPVELVSFTVSSTSSAIVLSWTTATEVNNYGFEVQRTLSGIEAWETIGFVEGHGNSSSPKEYSFIDSDKFSGTAKYRLKQVNIDGSTEYSEVVEVEGNLSYKLSQNHPNPFNPTTQITFTTPQAGLVKLNVYNVLGEVVAELINKNIEAGLHQYQFNANNLPSGIYFYSISINGFTEVKKMNLIK